jgi:hypothetical protein
MREVRFQRALLGRYLNATPGLAWNKPAPRKLRLYPHSECDVPLDPPLVSAHLAAGKWVHAHNVKTFGFLTCSRLLSGFPLAFVFRLTLEWLSRSSLWLAFSAYSSRPRFQP